MKTVLERPSRKEGYYFVMQRGRYEVAEFTVSEREERWGGGFICEWYLSGYDSPISEEEFEEIGDIIENPKYPYTTRDEYEKKYPNGYFYNKE